MANDGPELTYRAKLTKFFGHKLDFSKTGRLFTSGHKYSYRELFDRAFIIGGIIYLGYQGYHSSLPNIIGGSSTFWSVAGAITGFMTTHAVITLPLFKKRHNMQQACDETVNDIDDLMASFEKSGKLKPSKFQQLKEKVAGVVNYVKEFSYDNDKIGDASRTWGTRRRLLGTLKERLTTDVQEIELAEQPSPVFARKMKEHWNKPPADLKAELEQFTSNIKNKKGL